MDDPSNKKKRRPAINDSSFLQRSSMWKSLTLVVVVTFGGAVPALAQERCWDAIFPEVMRANDYSDIGIAGARGVVWLTQQTRVARRIDSMDWEYLGVPPGERSERSATVVSAAGQEAIVAFVAKGNLVGSTNIYVAKWAGSGWHKVAPVFPKDAEFHHVVDLALAWRKGAMPSVAWSETLGSDTAGVYAAQWSGNTWVVLPSLEGFGGGSQQDRKSVV